ncbi:MAG TPA: tetratricopeptide repeat protein [Smithellaceae bacterium]|nr:tetratricopeptide repeat protein [Smithellaceae bacterium]
MAESFITSYINRYVPSLYTNNYGVSSGAIDGFFSSTYANSQANLDSLSGTILGQGIDYFQNGNYNRAINAFRRAAALSPFSDNAVQSYNYIAQSYLRQEKTDEAIKTYKEAIRIYPRRDELHRSLADIYFNEGMPEEALLEYEEAVKINPDDEESRYSLGQSYISAGELEKARQQFSEVARLSPVSAAGYYGLGQVAHEQGNFEEAISKFKKAISVNRNFEIAYVELGKTYADKEDFINAQDMLRFLESKSSSKATELSAYMVQVQQPKIIGALGINGFNTTLEAGTEVADLSSTLATANKSKLFSLNIAFSKDMDEASIRDPLNWQITRANLAENHSVYNNGLRISTKEAVILSMPAYITYDSENNTATVNFWIKQNSTADATIDPEHIVFKFSGVDAYGKAMDISADEYSGFSSIA